MTTGSEIGEAVGVAEQAAWAFYNGDGRETLAAARGRSDLSDEEAPALADEARAEIRRGRSQG